MLSLKEITNSTSSMSLEQKKQLLLEIRQKKMLLRNFLQNEGNLDLGKITKQNTDRNKEYRCEFDVVVVRKNIPKPPSPSTKLQKQKKKANATESRKKVNSNIPVLKQRSGKEIANINLEKKDENSVEKCVRWDDMNLVQVSSPHVKHSPISTKEKRVIKPCLKPTNSPTDSLGNVLSADSSLTPIVKRGIKVTVKQVKYKGED